MNRGDDRLRGARVLVTGASGFLGANVVRALAAFGAEVHACVRRLRGWRVEAIEDVARTHVVDVSDAQAVLRIFGEVEPELVVHAATWRGAAPDRRAIVATDVGGAANLVDAALRHPPRRIVHIGSSLEYGHRREPLREDMRARPDTERGAAKLAATVLFEQAARARGLPVTILRAFSVYGPWEGPERLIPTAIRHARDRRPLPLTAPGPRRDLVFVDDVVDAIVAGLVRPLEPGEILNVGTGVQTSNEAVVETVARLMNVPVDVRPGSFPARATDSDHWVADTSRCRERLGWSARCDLAEGVERTIAWTLSRDPAKEC